MMVIFDTDMLSLLFSGNEKLHSRVGRMDPDDEITITIVTRIEVLQGRFDFLMKAADQEQLLTAMDWLERSERSLLPFRVIRIDEAAAAEFEKLRQVKKLRKIGRGDLLNGSIAISQKVTLVSRNIRHFEQIPGLHVENWMT